MGSIMAVIDIGPHLSDLIQGTILLVFIAFVIWLFMRD